MAIRRIVTGFNKAGKSIFLSDSPAPRTSIFTHTPGFETTLVWETPPGAAVPPEAVDPTISSNSWLPAPGGSNLMFVTFPPDSATAGLAIDPLAAGEEYTRLLSGLAEKFEADNPGMHTTDSIDYGIVLDGEMHLELDDGETKQIGVGDVVVQNGTRHAWRNKSERSAKMLFVLIGAHGGAR